MTKEKPRGVRNNNPGNIRRTDDKWQGLADIQPDNEFFTFKGPEWGIRAIARILIRYQDNHNLNTISKIITTWAPPIENFTDSYIYAVSKETGLQPDQLLNIHYHSHMFPLVKAIIRHECGYHPYPDDIINMGLAYAGIEVPKKPIRKSAAIKTGVLASTATTAAAGADISQQLLQASNNLAPFASTINIIKYACLGLTLIAVLFMIFQYIRDKRKSLI